MEQTKETINELLKEGIVKVEFKTVKGVDCTKYATLQESFLPPPKPVEEDVDENDALKKKRKVAENKVNFWSVEDNGWRSFLIENLVMVTILSEGEAEQFLIEQAKNAQVG